MPSTVIVPERSKAFSFPLLALIPPPGCIAVNHSQYNISYQIYSKAAANCARFNAIGIYKINIYIHSTPGIF